MSTPVIVGAVRTAIGRSFKGTLVNTPPETLITTVLPEVVRRSGLDPDAIDDIIFAESHYGGGDLARYAADADGHVAGARAVGQPALRGQPHGDRQRVGADRLRHGARPHRRRRAVAVDDAADELADPRPRTEVRGAVDAADPRRDARRARPRTCRSPSAGTPRRRWASPARRWTPGRRGRISAPSRRWTQASSSTRSSR